MAIGLILIACLIVVTIAVITRDAYPSDEEIEFYLNKARKEEFERIMEERKKK